jgi:acyl-CoA dehydrogenase
MDFSIPESIKEYLDSVRIFIKKHIEPIAEQVDRDDDMPQFLIEKMGEMGLFGLSISKKYGGLGLTVLESCIITEELAKAGLAFVRLIGGGDLDISEFGSEEQKNRYLPKLSTGKIIGATAMTESEAGSDARNIKTSAVEVNGRLLLNGTKIMIQRADIAGLFSITAVTNPGKNSKGRITRFLVERKSKGLHVGKPDRKMGLNGIHTCQVILTDCPIGYNDVLGEIGDGLSGMLKTLNIARLRIIGAAAIGNAQKLLEVSIDHAKRRIQFGKEIAANQAIQWMLSDMATKIYASRMIMYHAAWLADLGKDIRREAAIVKLFASEMACHVADMAIQIQGGYGYMKGCLAERYFRDNRAARIMDGTSEIQRIVIARDLLKSWS